MARYVPADSLIYIEANSIPILVNALTQTKAWKEMAPLAGFDQNFSHGYLGRIAAWTGLGTSEAVILGRAQLSIAVLDVETSGSDGALSITPRAALIIQTHTSSRRVRPVLERHLGNFARRSFGDFSLDQRQDEQTLIETWLASDGKRQIVAALTDTLAIIGNDEESVQACLAVYRGRRPSLYSNAEMKETRNRLAESIAFGYVPMAGATKLLEIFAGFYATQMASDQRVQSGLASTFPEITARILKSVAWGARHYSGTIEDVYLISLQGSLPERLAGSLAAQAYSVPKAVDILPVGTYSLSQYNYTDPQEAWRGLNRALSAQLDTWGALVATTLLDSMSQAYGIDDPQQFLGMVGSSIVTTKLDEATESNLVIAEVRDEKRLKEHLSRRFGSTRVTKISEFELITSRDPQRGAAIFSEGYVIVGAQGAVKEIAQGQARLVAIGTDPAFQRATKLASSTSSPPGVVTYSNDQVSALRFFRALKSQQGIVNQDEAQLVSALKNLDYSVTETRLTETGFERRSYSSFGQLGSLFGRFFGSD